MVRFVFDKDWKFIVLVMVVFDYLISFGLLWYCIVFLFGGGLMVFDCFVFIIVVVLNKFNIEIGIVYCFFYEFCVGWKFFYLCGNCMNYIGWLGNLDIIY